MNSTIANILKLLLSWMKQLCSFLWGLGGSVSTMSVSSLWIPILSILLVGFSIFDLWIYHRRWRPDWLRRSLKEYPFQNTDSVIEEKEIPSDTPMIPAPERSSEPPSLPVMEYERFSPQPSTPSIDDFIVLTEEPRFDDAATEWNDFPEAPPAESNIKPYSTNSSPSKAISRQEESVNIEGTFSRFGRLTRGALGLSTPEDLKRTPVYCAVNPQDAFQAPVFPEENRQQ